MCIVHVKASEEGKSTYSYYKNYAFFSGPLCIEFTVSANFAIKINFHGILIVIDCDQQCCHGSLILILKS